MKNHHKVIDINIIKLCLTRKFTKNSSLVTKRKGSNAKYQARYRLKDPEKIKRLGTKHSKDYRQRIRLDPVKKAEASRKSVERKRKSRENKKLQDLQELSNQGPSSSFTTPQVVKSM